MVWWSLSPQYLARNISKLYEEVSFALVMEKHNGFLTLFYLLLMLRIGRSMLQEKQSVEEHVFITHLPDARVMAHFEFKTTWNVHPLLFAHKNKGKYHYIIKYNIISVQCY